MKFEFACTMRDRLRGLYGRRSFDGIIVIVPCNDVHTLGMKQPLDVAFVARDGTVLSAFRNVGPNRRLRNRHAAATFERFACNSAWYEAGDSVTLHINELDET